MNQKKMLIFFLTLLFSSQSIFANDFIVRDNGAGGAYATISAAITAAADGDRIIIRPKVSGTPYIENVTINKSLTLLTEIQGDKYEILGSITIAVTANRTVTIQDANLVSSNSISLTGSVSGARANINILNSTVSGSISLDEDNVTATVIGNDITGLIEFKHGKVIANACSRIRLNNDTGNVLSSEDNYIIANNCRRNANGFTHDYLTRIESANYPIHIYNNYFYESSGASLSIHTLKIGTTNNIYNNFFQNYHTTRSTLEIFFSNSTTTVNIINNVFDSGSGDYNIEAPGATYINAQYNLFEYSYDLLNADVDVNNIVGNFNITNFVITGDNIDAGNPDNTFADTDLTRNDMGLGGGSFSWSNFWTGENQKPHVYFLNVPRRIFNGTNTFNANGNAITK